MRVKYTVAVHALERNAHWIEQLVPGRLVDQVVQDRVTDLVTWCLDFVELSPTTDISAWLLRRPHRKLLDEPVRGARLRKGRLAIVELINLTVSELLASAPFLPEVEVSLLPGAKAPAKRTTEHVAAMRNGWRAHRAKQERDRTRRFAAAGAPVSGV